MEINKNLNGNELTIALSGRLDTLTSPQLEEVLKESLGDVLSLVYDLADLQYISSSGLRVLLFSQKSMSAKGGKMIIRNACSDVKEVFDITGFSSILTIE